jgi:hypothetical protein
MNSSSSLARAIKQGTSLSAKVQEFLQNYVNESDDALRTQRGYAAARLMRTIADATSQTQSEATVSAAPGRQSLRDDLYADDFRTRVRPSAAIGYGG